jgi:hypothetical protein
MDEAKRGAAPPVLLSFPTKEVSKEELRGTGDVPKKNQTTVTHGRKERAMRWKSWKQSRVIQRFGLRSRRGTERKFQANKVGRLGAVANPAWGKGEERGKQQPGQASP